MAAERRVGRSAAGRGPSGREAGFTLLEVLIAFAIAAASLAVLFRVTVESQTATAVAARYQEALSRARSRLAVLETGPLRAADQQGDDGGGFRWRVRVAPLATAPTIPPGAAGPPALFAVTVAVSWRTDGRERSVALDTRRLGNAPPPAP